MTEAETATQALTVPTASLSLEPTGLYDRISLRRVASESTLIRWEKEGRIQSIALGCRRFYLGRALLAARQSTK